MLVNAHEGTIHAVDADVLGAALSIFHFDLGQWSLLSLQCLLELATMQLLSPRALHIDMFGYCGKVGFIAARWASGTLCLPFV